MANDSGFDIETLRRRLTLLLENDWGLHVVELRYFNGNDWCTEDSNSNLVPNTEDLLDEHCVIVGVGYGNDAALQSYDVWFRGVANGAQVARSFAAYRKKHRGYPNLVHFNFSETGSDLNSIEFGLENYRMDPNSLSILETYSQDVSFNFSNLNWTNHDVYAMDPETYPHDIPPE